MFDLLIKNGTVLDGTGAEGILADVAVKDGKIAAVGQDLGETAQVIESVEEFITIAKAAQIRGVVSHHKAAQAQNHGKVKTTIAMLEKANAEGCDLYCDVYPYTASHTRLAACFIPSAYVNSHLAEYLSYVIIGGEIVAENAVYNGKTPAKLLKTLQDEVLREFLEETN